VAKKQKVGSGMGLKSTIAQKDKTKLSGSPPLHTESKTSNVGDKGIRKKQQEKWGRGKIGVRRRASGGTMDCSRCTERETKNSKKFLSSGHIFSGLKKKKKEFGLFKT